MHATGEVGDGALPNPAHGAVTAGLDQVDAQAQPTCGFPAWGAASWSRRCCWRCRCCPLPRCPRPGPPTVPPPPELCAADATRGAVPAAFPLEACVDGSGMTLRNDRDRPAVVSVRGDFGPRVMLRSQNDAPSDVVRRTSPSALVLLPGEVARRPFGAGTAVLTVAPLPVPAAPEIAQVLDPVLGG